MIVVKLKYNAKIIRRVTDVSIKSVTSNSVGSQQGDDDWRNEDVVDWQDRFLPAR